MNINHKSKLIVIAGIAILGVGGLSVGVVHALNNTNQSSVGTKAGDTDAETNDDQMGVPDAEDNGNDGETNDDATSQGIGQN